MSRIIFSKNRRGQGMIEYLIIVAIIAIGSISVMKVVGGNVSVRFANVANVLGGKGKNPSAYEVTDTMVKKKDFSNFFDGAVTSSRSKEK
ncbi:MAG: hypothetical protein AAGB31_06020 [Bdellovibrio sp.]